MEYSRFPYCITYKYFSSLFFPEIFLTCVYNDNVCIQITFSITTSIYEDMPSCIM